MTIWNFIVYSGCFLLAGIIPGVPVIIALLVHVWWDKRKQRLASFAKVSSAHRAAPYREAPRQFTWRFVRVHAQDVWSCAVCGASVHDDCDPGLHS